VRRTRRRRGVPPPGRTRHPERSAPVPGAGASGEDRPRRRPRPAGDDRADAIGHVRATAAAVGRRGGCHALPPCASCCSSPPPPCPARPARGRRRGSCAGGSVASSLDPATTHACRPAASFGRIAATELSLGRHDLAAQRGEGGARPPSAGPPEAHASSSSTTHTIASP
jgi:hypothetical protein